MLISLEWNEWYDYDDDNKYWRGLFVLPYRWLCKVNLNENLELDNLVLDMKETIDLRGDCRAGDSRVIVFVD